jgi:hypothetical protein
MTRLHPHLRRAVQWLIVILTLACGPLAATATDSNPDQSDGLTRHSLLIRLQGNSSSTSSKSPGYNSRSRQLASALQFRGFWTHESRRAHVTARFGLSGRSQYHWNNTGNRQLSPWFYSVTDRSHEGRVNGELSAAMSMRLYPGDTPLNVVADVNFNRNKTHRWWAYRHHARNEFGSSEGYYHLTGWQNDYDLQAGAGLGFGRVSTEMDLVSTEQALKVLAQRLNNSDLPTALESLRGEDFLGRFRDPRSRGYRITLRVGMVNSREKSHDFGSMRYSGVDDSSGRYAYYGSNDLSEGRGWNDAIVGGPVAEYHLPIATRFQLDAWARMESDLEYDFDYPDIDASLRFEALLHPLWRAEVWGVHQRWYRSNWQQWYHLRLGCDVDRACEVNAAITVLHYPPGTGGTTVKMQLGLSIWFDGAAAPPQVSFPSAVPDWLSD